MKGVFKYILIVSIFIVPIIAVGQNKARLIVKVIDKKSNRPVGNAEVTLIKLSSDYVNIEKKILLTDQNGTSTFRINRKINNFSYSVSGRKEKFYPYFNLQNQINESYKDNISVIWGKRNKIELYLYSDIQNAIKFNAILHPRIPIETVIMFLKSNKYDVLQRNYNTTFPHLIWEDIPELLKIGNSKLIINNFPVNPLSSSTIRECQLGVIALWMIESIRICEGKLPIFSIRYPSLIPKIKSDIADPDESFKLLYIAYQDWWEVVKTMSPEEASKINPLENRAVKW